jgi:RNA polymerase sigma-B factor
MSAAEVGSVSGSRHSGEEARELLQAYRSRRDTGARDRLVELHMPLVRTLAKRYVNRGEQLEDLVQIGSIGLLQAIERFDPARGRDLAGFAAPTIAGEIRHHLRDRATVVRIPRRHVDSAIARSAIPLSTSDEADPRLGRAIATDAPYDSSEDRLMLVASLRTLTVRERRIMHLRYFAGLSQDEIARQVGLSQVQVSRLIRASLERMRGALTASGSAGAQGHGSRVEA